LKKKEEKSNIFKKREFLMLYLFLLFFSMKGLTGDLFAYIRNFREYCMEFHFFIPQVVWIKQINDVMKRVLFSILLFAMFGIGWAQESVTYEFEREMPRFLNQLKEELTYPMAWGNSDIEEFDVWREKARSVVFDAMLMPPARAEEYELEVIGEEQRDGYTARKIQWNLTAYSRVNAYLLVPDGKGPFPAVVLLHDHGGHYTIGKEKMIRPFDVSESLLEDADNWAKSGYGGRYLGDFLAANGYVVIAIDAYCWGERGRKEGINAQKIDVIAGNFQMLGRSLSAFVNYEDLYTTEFLASLPEVDAKRVGCMGWSMGAYRAWMLSALTDKIAAGVAVCWMNVTDVQFSWEYGKERGGFLNALPALRRYMDYPHIASIACPKPMFFLNGTKDGLFPVVGVKQAFEQMREVWKSQGVDSLLRTEIWEMPHDCGLEVQNAALEFFHRHLR